MNALVLRFVPRADKKPLPRFLIVNDVLAPPYRAKFAHTSFCIIEGLNSLNKMQSSVGLHLVDAEGQLNYDWGQNFRKGQRSDYDMDETALETNVSL